MLSKTLYAKVITCILTNGDQSEQTSVILRSFFFWVDYLSPSGQWYSTFWFYSHKSLCFVLKEEKVHKLLCNWLEEQSLSLSLTCAILLCVPTYMCMSMLLVFMWLFWLLCNRCGATQSGDLGSSGEGALDGILGFGKSNSSIISQLASSGKVKNMFAHCLDGKNGGGIFAIGRVVQPKVNMTPLVPNQYVFILSFW